MSGNTQLPSVTPNLYLYRSHGTSESTMKKVVVIGGSIMLLILFGLIFAVNIQNENWDDSEKIIGFCISTAGLLIFSTILISYSIYHLKRERQRSLASSSICTNNVERNNENELPPSYEEIMGKLPTYESYRKSKGKNITIDENANENTQYICHV